MPLAAPGKVTPRINKMNNMRNGKVAVKYTTFPTYNNRINNLKHLKWKQKKVKVKTNYRFNAFNNANINHYPDQ